MSRPNSGPDLRRGSQTVLPAMPGAWVTVVMAGHVFPSPTDTPDTVSPTDVMAFAMTFTTGFSRSLLPGGERPGSGAVPAC
jgi:hypothetical protein